jgi:hypothetical protein
MATKEYRAYVGKLRIRVWIDCQPCGDRSMVEMNEEDFEPEKLTCPLCHRKAHILWNN